MAASRSYTDGHYDRVLTNLSIAYFQGLTKFVAPMVFKTVTVKKASDRYRIFPKGYFSRIDVDTTIAEESKANRIDYASKTEAYAVQEHGLRKFISDKSRANVDKEQNLDFEATQLVMEHLLIGREKDWSDRFMRPGVWTGEYSGAASGTGVTDTYQGSTGSGTLVKWSNSGGDPIKNMTILCTEMQERTLGRRPNSLLMSRDVWDELKHHDMILDRVQGGATTDNPARTTMNLISGLFEVQRILIMETVVNQAVDGIIDDEGNPPEDIVFLKKNFFFLYHQAPTQTPALYTPTAGVNFVWQEYIPHSNTGGMGAGPWMRRYRETPAVLGEYLEGRYAQDWKVLSADCGTFCTDII